MPASRYYTEKGHVRALEIHSERWDDMHSIRVSRGVDNDDYRQARQDVLDAMKSVRYEARKPRRPRSAASPSFQAKSEED